MKVAHLVLSNTFAEVEYYVDELLSYKLDDKSLLICNNSIADYLIKVFLYIK